MNETFGTTKFSKLNQPPTQIQVAKPAFAPQVKLSGNPAIRSFSQQAIQGAALALFVRRFGAFATVFAVA